MKLGQKVRVVASDSPQRGLQGRIIFAGNSIYRVKFGDCLCKHFCDFELEAQDPIADLCELLD